MFLFYIEVPYSKLSKVAGALINIQIIIIILFMFIIILVAIEKLHLVGLNFAMYSHSN